MKPFYFCFLAIIVFPLASFAQYFTIDTARGDSPYNGDISFIFPQLRNSVNQAVADSINKVLIRDVLKIEPGTQKYSIFENIWGTKPLDVARVGDISFKVINNDEGFISIAISATECETNCESWTRHYNRDSKTGQPILISDLFTGEGLQRISDSIKVMNNSRMKDYTDTLRFAVKNKPLSDDDKRDYTKAADQYDKCMKSSWQYGADYSFDRAQLTIYAGHCLPYELTFLDKIDHAFQFSMDDIKGYLTDYGKSILK